MIKCGQELYPDCQFIAGDFLQYHPTNNEKNSDDEYFDGIIFCSSLHDMPNMYLVLEKAISLLRNTPGSTLVIVHAQGAGHVQMQHVKNPILVPQLLPTASELQSFIDSYNDKNTQPKNLMMKKKTTNDDDDVNDDTSASSTSPSLYELLPLQLTVAPADANTPNDQDNGYLAVISKKNCVTTE
jgi:hypothetical protein